MKRLGKTDIAQQCPLEHSHGLKDTVTLSDVFTTNPTGRGMTDVLEQVKEDPELLPCEKETTFSFAKDEDRARVHTDEAGLMRRLLQHPEFEITELRLHTQVGYRYVDCEQDLTECDSVIGVKGSIPVTALLVKSASRAQRAHCHVVAV